jgi:hypothetical protein
MKSRMFVALLLAVAISACDSDPEPNILPNEKEFYKLWALRTVPIGSPVLVYGIHPDGKIGYRNYVVCNVRQESQKNGGGAWGMVVDIRESLVACNSGAAKTEATPWQWVISGGKPTQYRRVMGIALPCGSRLREEVANPKPEQRWEQWQAVLPKCDEAR